MYILGCVSLRWSDSQQEDSMEVPALCVTLWTDVLLLLLVRVDHSCFAQKADFPAFPRVLPDRLQFFEYVSVRVICQESGWRVMRRLNNRSRADSYTWNSSAPSRTIDPTFESQSGSYWCEDAEGNTSNAVNISIVNPASVILEVPASPVSEGDNVSLYCRKKDGRSNHIPDFYKDGSTLGTQYSGKMTIRNVSKSDEGLYKCSIPKAGESPQSWLAVSKGRKGDGDMFNNSVPAADKETGPSGRPPSLPILVWIGVGVSLGALILLGMGLLLSRKHRVFGCLSSNKPEPGSHSPADPTDSGERIAIQHHATYAVVKKQRREKVCDGDHAGDLELVTYAAVKKQRKKKEPSGSRSGSKGRLTDDSAVYSTINYRPHAPD
ncbi:uncharacterized protein LOC117935169 [Etheostoma cragini]|uniref:uncharacterized protein LOC117935169 n=1 Tax=Etheostoma cragini TaxID=417921 RepID=UPI00155EE61A|nr:uncharacterized protein LOC117935169 [Etheostoma cragini]